MKKSIIILSLLSSVFYFSQVGNVGINTSNPESTLDIHAKNHLGAVSSTDGILVPRVASLGTGGTVNGQLVYLAADNGSFTKGFHYWDGSVWVPIYKNLYTADGTISGNRTVTQGSKTLAFTSTATNGFSVDGSTFSVDAANHRIGIGTVSPSSKLEVTDGSGVTILDKSGSGLAQKLSYYSTTGAASSSDWKQYKADGTDTNYPAGIHWFSYPKSGGSSISLSQLDNGNIGVGVINPSAKLEVAGKTKTTNFQMTNGAGAGRVLTSDASGNATWQLSGGNTAANEPTLGLSNSGAWSLTVTDTSNFVQLPGFNSAYLTPGIYLINLYQCAGQLTVSPANTGVYWSLISNDGGVGNGSTYYVPVANNCGNQTNFIFKVSTAGNFKIAVKKYTTDVTYSAPATYNASINPLIDALSH